MCRNNEENSQARVTAEGIDAGGDAPSPTWRELAVPFVPIAVLCLALSFVFDTTRLAWLVPFIGLMTGGFVWPSSSPGAAPHGGLRPGHGEGDLRTGSRRKLCEVLREPSGNSGMPGCT